MGVEFSSPVINRSGILFPRRCVTDAVFGFLVNVVSVLGMDQAIVGIGGGLVV